MLAVRRESEELYRRLFEVESDAIVLVDNESGRILAANAAAAGLYGYSREELVSMNRTDLSAEPTRPFEPRSQGRHSFRCDGGKRLPRPLVQRRNCEGTAPGLKVIARKSGPAAAGAAEELRV
jgi:PAS domain S-box-containing protein